MRAMPSKVFPYIDKALKNTKMALFIDHVENNTCRRYRQHDA